MSRHATLSDGQRVELPSDGHEQMVRVAPWQRVRVLVDDEVVLDATRPDRAQVLRVALDEDPTGPTSTYEVTQQIVCERTWSVTAPAGTAPAEVAELALREGSVTNTRTTDQVTGVKQLGDRRTYHQEDPHG